MVMCIHHALIINCEVIHIDLQVENEDVFPSKLEQVDPCLHGDHQFILDEQIGLRCTCCSYVKLEIRDIVPSFVSHLPLCLFMLRSSSGKYLLFLCIMYILL